MKVRWIGSGVAALGCLWAGSAGAQYDGQPLTVQPRQPQLIATSPGPAPAATLGRPVAVELGAPVAMPNRPPAVAPRIQDPGVVPTGYAAPAPAPVVRAQKEDLPSPPLGRPRMSGSAAVMTGFAADRALPAPARAPAPVPAPVPASVIPTTFDNPPAGGAPPLAARPMTGTPVGAPLPQAGPVVVSPGAPGGVPFGGDPACCDVGPCCEDSCCFDPGRFYLTTEYLGWWVRGDNFPPLVTTGPPASQGILGRPGTTVLVGGSQSAEMQSGVRLGLGLWLGECRTWGLDTSYFYLGDRSNHFALSSAGVPGGVLARPFFNVNPNGAALGFPFGEFSELIALPGLATGSVVVRNPTELFGGEVNLRRNLCCGCNYRVDGLVGFRYLELNESLQVMENVMINPDPAVGGSLAGSTVLLNDDIGTRNQFYGANLGTQLEWRFGRLSVDLRNRLGLGVNHQTINIAGSSLQISPTGAMTSSVGGLLALNSNIGQFSRNRFSVVPEVGVNLGYWVTPNFRLTAGYNLLYFTNVVRPGGQVDRMIDIARIPNGGRANMLPLAPLPRPMVPFRETDLWAQGITLGFEFRY